MWVCCLNNYAGHSTLSSIYEQLISSHYDINFCTAKGNNIIYEENGLWVDQKTVIKQKCLNMNGFLTEDGSCKCGRRDSCSGKSVFSGLELRNYY